MSWQRIRTIVEEPTASEAVDLYSRQYARFGDAWEALKWLLARRVERPVQSREAGGVRYHLYKQAGDPIALTPDITVLLSYDEQDNEIVVHDVRATPHVDQDEDD